MRHGYPSVRDEGVAGSNPATPTNNSNNLSHFRVGSVQTNLWFLAAIVTRGQSMIIPRKVAPPSIETLPTVEIHTHFPANVDFYLT